MIPVLGPSCMSNKVRCQYSVAQPRVLYYSMYFNIPGVTKSKVHVQSSISDGSITHNFLVHLTWRCSIFLTATCTRKCVFVKTIANINHNPECWKMLNRKRTSILDGKFLNYERLLHPVQCTSWKRRFCKSIDTIVLSEASGILSKSDPFNCLWGTNVVR